MASGRPPCIKDRHSERPGGGFAGGSNGFAGAAFALDFPEIRGKIILSGFTDNIWEDSV